MSRSAGIYGGILILFLAGCSHQAITQSPSTLSRPQDFSISSAGSAMTDLLFKYVQRFNGLQAEQQKKEFANLNTQRRTEFGRMQIALISSQPGSKFFDASRAQMLLEEHLKSPESKDEGLRMLATILRNQLVSQKRADDATQQLKDEQKKSESLQRKLDELLAIERSINERQRNHLK